MKKIQRFLGISGALALLGGGLVACADSSGASEDTVKVGAILSLSGGGATMGEAEARSMELAVEKVNAAGGANGKQIELILEDDKSQPSEAVTVAQSLITEDQVSAIFGATSGSSTLAFLPIAQQNQIPVLAPNATLAVVEEFPEGVYRTTPSDTIIVEASLQYLADHDLTQIALLTENAAFGAQTGDAIEDRAAEFGLEVVREEYDTASTDLKPELTKIRGENPDAIVVWGTGPAPSIAFKNMRDLDMSDLPRLAPLGVATEDNIELADGAMDGVLIPGVIDAEDPMDGPESEFVSAYKEAFDMVPTTLDAIAWDPAFLYAAAADSAGSTDSVEVQNALDELCDFEGVVGMYCYSDSHDGLSTDAVDMLRIEEGKFVAAQE